MESAPYQVKKLAIVGSHPDTRARAPWDDLDYDIWCFNEAPHQPNTYVKRWNACFQLHHPTIYTNPHNRTDPQHWQWLQDENSPEHIIYMQAVDPRVPCSKQYPLDAVKGMMSGFTYPAYFQTSVSYAFALAALQGYKHISVYGIEMASQTEYVYQRANVAFWIGYALGRGIVVDMHGGKDIFSQPLYGYEGNLEIKLDAFQPRIDELRGVAERAMQEKQSAEMAAELALNPNTLGAYVNACVAYGAARGAMGEAERYAWKVKAMVDESGTAILDRNEYEGAAGQAARDMQQFQAELQRTSGLIDYAMRPWLATKDPNARKLLDQAIPPHLKAAQEFGVCRGIFEENNRMMRSLDDRIQAAGGARGKQAFIDNSNTANRSGKAEA